MIGSHSNVDPHTFVALLKSLGSPMTTRVTLNGRPVLLGAVMTMVERLPEGTRFGNRGSELFIDPDPFAPAPESPSGPPADGPASADLVRRLIERQDATDQDAACQGRRGWLGRLRRVLF